MKLNDEFWGEWMRDNSSTDPRERRVRWKVAEIVKVHKYGHWGPMIDAPRLEPLKIEYRNPKFITASG